MKLMLKGFLQCIFWISIVNSLIAQNTNTDPTISYINVDVPKTPESAGFEKYGTPQVNEFTGTSVVDIPLYTLKAKFLQVPIGLSYHATGIKVNQEASWVGLGFDLMAGGRITVETKGSIDFCSSTNGLTSAPTRNAGMQKIFARLGNSRENAVATFATLCEPSCTDPNFDDPAAMQEMVYYGTGEPDVFHANFLGHSFSFFIDKITGSTNFIGEKNLFAIGYTLDNYNNITGWTVTDNTGIKYYFNQVETTTNTLTSNPVVPASSTSAWLLTRIEHPTGDYVNFTYTNYGYSVPAFNMSGTVDYMVSNGTIIISSDQYQNVTLQSPYYLTQIESQNALVNFSLSTRTDLYGAGSRKLSAITITDKSTNQVKKTIGFNYDYFQSTYKPWASYLNQLFYSLPVPMSQTDYLACSDSRLRLVSLAVTDPGNQPPYFFFYNGLAMDKYDYGQDHWGYYNAVNNSSYGYKFIHLIPNAGTFGVQNAIPNQNFDASNIGVSRECDAQAMQAMMLNKIVYPTGGSTEFTYEPHQSSTVTLGSVTGGGLRVKTIKNYSFEKLTGTTEYSYSGGKYMGNIQYFTTSNVLDACDQGLQGHIKYSSNGAVNANQILLGYNTVTVTQKDENGQSNGSVVKTFNIITSSSSNSNSGGFDIQAPYFSPDEEIPTYPGSHDWIFYLNAGNKDFSPTPASNLEGKLMEEQYLDNTGNLIKSISYHYTLADYSNNFYDIKAIQNRLGGFQYCSGQNGGFNNGGDRPVILFVSPAKSFFTLTDQVVEKTFNGSSYLSITKNYQFNSFYQPVYESVDNSNGSQSITYTKTAADMGSYYKFSLPATSDGNNIMNMYTAHIYDLPVEQTVVNKPADGDPIVVSSRFNVYNGVLPEKVYVTEALQPLVYGSDFVPAFYNYSGYPSYPPDNNATLKIDDRYQLYNSADYSSSGLINTLYTRKGNTAYIWDETYNTLMAQCVNATFNNIAATSFETSATGGWTYSATGVVSEPHAPTGNYGYNLSAGGINITGLDASQNYIVSYWSNNGSSFSVTSSTQAPKQGGNHYEWTYYEQPVSSTTSVSITGSAHIDELRLYPSTAQMTSYTYDPLVGQTSVTDLNGRISYYEYDSSSRLKLVRDKDNNILKTFQYVFQEQH